MQRRQTEFRDATALPIQPPSLADIARRAYELFEARRHQHGHDLDDWLEAERQLTEASLQQFATV